MWHFAVGLYLVKLSGGQLRLAAIHGFCSGGFSLLLGGLIGAWVDKNQRMKGQSVDTCNFLITGRCRLVDFLFLVMVTSLSIQNISVALSATAVFITLHFSPDWVEQHGACEEFSHSSKSTLAS